MMNVSFSLREQEGFCTPVGPSFKRARRITTSILGSKLEFRAPKHRPNSRVKDKGDFPKSNYTLSNMTFRSNFSPEFEATDTWESILLFSHAWRFNGPWFTGVLASMGMVFSIVRVKDSVQAKNCFSYYHPRAFEQSVGDYLSNRFSVPKTDGRSEWIAPVNWQPISSLPVVAARLQVVRDELVTRTEFREYLFFPISDDQLAVITFSPHQREMGTQAEQDAVIGRSSMVELMDNIIGSLKLTLSPEAAAQQAKALEGLDDTSLIEEFLPIKWTTAEDDALWKKNEQKWVEYRASIKRDRQGRVI